MKNEKPAEATTDRNQQEDRIIKLSQGFLFAAKMQKEVHKLVHELKTLTPEHITSSLDDDQKKKAFWINLYNGFTQSLLRQNPALYRNRERFFNTKQIEVAGKKLSLDDIEHGILRRSTIKWSLGYLRKIFPGKTEKAWRVAALDFRIHFALNCGAQSCPPVAFYTPERLDQQLDLATAGFLQSEVEVEGNTVFVPTIMHWFRGDFGGKKGIKQLLRKHGFAAVNSSTKLKFKNYHWALDLENFTGH